MSANRLFEIVYLLLDRRQMTAAELAERFEVSVRTIYRDIDALSAAGVPVYTTQGKGGGVSLMDHYVLNRASFSEEEQKLLLTALQSLPETDRLGAGETLAKLSGLFRRQEAEWLQVNLSRWGNGQADNRKFDLLKRAVRERHAVRFTYVSSYGLTTDRKVLPARLVFKGQAWYLQGFCTEKKAFRTFKLTRMLTLAVLDGSFDRIPDPPPIEGDEAQPMPCTPVRLRFLPTMAYRVYDEFDEHCITREADGFYTVRVALPEDDWLYGYLLSFGTAVTVLEPERVRDGLKRMAYEIWRQAGEPDRGCQVMGATIGTSKRQEVPNMEQMNQKFCQSCGMPLSSPDDHGTEADGGLSEHYCKYCYQNGAFSGEMTMEDMVDFCVPMMVQANPGMTAEQAKAQMMAYFPQLLRWKK